jgi:hypothetical protein
MYSTAWFLLFIQINNKFSNPTSNNFSLTISKHSINLINSQFSNNTNNHNKYSTLISKITIPNINPKHYSIQIKFLIHHLDRTIIKTTIIRKIRNLKKIKEFNSIFLVFKRIQWIVNKTLLLIINTLIMPLVLEHLTFKLKINNPSLWDWQTIPFKNMSLKMRGLEAIVVINLEMLPKIYFIREIKITL